MTKSMWFATGALVRLVGSSNAQSQETHEFQPVLGARIVQLLHHEGLQLRGLNKNGKVDVYEDWRQPVSNRVEDLVTQMNLEEKAGMWMVKTLDAETHGRLSGQAVQYVQDEGLAATCDLDLIAEFARIVAREWTPVGLRSMYGYMAGLAAEPRWFRNHETFTEEFGR